MFLLGLVGRWLMVGAIAWKLLTGIWRVGRPNCWPREFK